MYKFDGEVFKIVMSCNTSDITQFCKQEWLEWVMFWDEIAPFADNVLNFGHTLGRKYRYRLDMMAKVFTENGEVLHRSIYRLLTADKIADKDGQIPESSSWLDSMKSWHPRSYQESWRTLSPHYYQYEDETQHKLIFPQSAKELEPTSEEGHHFIGAELLLP